MPALEPLARFTADTAAEPAEAPPAAPAPAAPTLLSPADVAAVFGRDVRTLRRWAERGFLTPVRIGRSNFYRPADVTRLIADGLEAAIVARTMGQKTGCPHDNKELTKTRNAHEFVNMNEVLK